MSPVVDPGFLSTQWDVVGLRESVRTALRFVKAPAWEGYVIDSATLNLTDPSDEQIDAYVRATAGTLFHPVGTASMSPRGANYGVVDPDLRVKGVVGLRVIDASVVVSFSCMNYLSSSALNACHDRSLSSPLHTRRRWCTFSQRGELT